MVHYIAAVYRDRGLAERVISALRDAAVRSGDISLVVREEAEETISSRDELEGDATFSGLAVHSAWERMGWQNSARPGYRDRVPPNIELAFLAAGPLAIALGGAQIGATAGGIVGGIGNFGFNHEFAQQCYDRIVDGGAFVMVGTPPDRLDPVRDTLCRFQPDLVGETIRPW